MTIVEKFDDGKVQKDYIYGYKVSNTTSKVEIQNSLKLTSCLEFSIFKSILLVKKIEK